MRGRRNPQITMLAFIDLEERVPATHPLRTIKQLADEALADLSPVFDEMYAENGPPSTAPVSVRIDPTTGGPRSASGGASCTPSRRTMPICNCRCRTTDPGVKA